MAEFFDFKFIIATAATILVVIAHVPYFKDIFAGKTKPHLYTWLIWGITQGTATVALLHGGGRFGSLSLIVETILVIAVVALSFKYGTKDITNGDKVILLLALAAIVVWWQLDNPWVAVLMVSAIDGVGYIPTIRKSFKDPWSETLSFWAILALVELLALLANTKYNFLTVAYLTTLFTASVAVSAVCFSRRRAIQRKQRV